jgi:arylformamidase
LLFKTINGRFWDDESFHEEFVGLELDAARVLVERGVSLVGIDYLSIEKFKAPGHKTHVALLESGVVIVEGLDLRAVPAGEYTMCCAPLKVVGAEGAPARVFLWDELPA